MKPCRYSKRIIDKAQFFDFLAPVTFRIYLAPIFWVAGMEKFQHMESTIKWFANSDWGLGLPFPALLAYLAVGSELIGAVCLLFGFAVRFAAIPLMITMLVAAFSVHLDNGWLAIAHQHSEAATRLKGFLAWLKQHYPERHGFITELGKPVMLNNGIEFAITYFIMLLSLFFTGAGKYFSLDYWFAKCFRKHCKN